MLLIPCICHAFFVEGCSTCPQCQPAWSQNVRKDCYEMYFVEFQMVCVLVSNFVLEYTQANGVALSLAQRFCVLIFVQPRL